MTVRGAIRRRRHRAAPIALLGIVAMLSACTSLANVNVADQSPSSLLGGSATATYRALRAVPLSGVAAELPVDVAIVALDELSAQGRAALAAATGLESRLLDRVESAALVRRGSSITATASVRGSRFFAVPALRLGGWTMAGTWALVSPDGAMRLDLGPDGLVTVRSDATPGAAIETSASGSAGPDATMTADAACEAARDAAGEGGLPEVARLEALFGSAQPGLGRPATVVVWRDRLDLGGLLTIGAVTGLGAAATDSQAIAAIELADERSARAALATLRLVAPLLLETLGLPATTRPATAREGLYVTLGPVDGGAEALLQGMAGEVMPEAGEFPQR